MLERHNFISKLISYLGIPLFFLVIFILVYAPVIQKGFYVSDDYYLFISDKEEVCDPLVLTISGRIVTSFFTCLKARYMASSSENTKNLRLLGIIGIALLAFIIYTIFKRFRFKTNHAFLMSTLICTLPAFQVYVSWLSCLTYIYSALLSCLSALIVFNVVFKEEGKGRTYTVLGVLSAIILLLIALNTYQPAAMMYWAMGAIFLLTRDSGNFLKKDRTLFIKYFFVGLVSLMSYFVVFIKIMPHILNLPIISRRGSLISIQDIPSRLILFLTSPFRDSINLWNINPTYKFAIFISVIIFIGVIFGLLKEIKEKKTIYSGYLIYLQRYFLIMCLIMLSYLPNLIVIEKITTYRTLISLETTLSILLFCGILNIVEFFKFIPNFSAESRKKIMTILLLALTIITTFLAHNNVNKYFAMPNSNEFNYVKKFIQDRGRANSLRTSKIYVRRPMETLPAAHAEFAAVPATLSDCGPVEQVVKLALKDIGIKQEIPIIHGAPDAPVPDDKNILIIDMTKFK